MPLHLGCCHEKAQHFILATTKHCFVDEAIFMVTTITGENGTLALTNRTQPFTKKLDHKAGV